MYIVTYRVNEKDLVPIQVKFTSKENAKNFAKSALQRGKKCVTIFNRCFEDITQEVLKAS